MAAVEVQFGDGAEVQRFVVFGVGGEELFEELCSLREILLGGVDGFSGIEEALARGTGRSWFAVGVVVGPVPGLVLRQERPSPAVHIEIHPH